jgi:hemerythrin
MGRIRWDDTLAIGIPLLDDQHKTWVEHLDALATAIDGRFKVPQVVKTLDFLIDYTNFHFSFEEAQMAEVGYPWLEEHKRKHQDLRETLRTLVLDYEEDGPTERLVETVNDLLRTWLTRHIREVDGVFAAYVRENGIQIAGA